MSIALSLSALKGCPDWFVDYTNRFDKIPYEFMVATVDADTLEPWENKSVLSREIQKTGRHAAAAVLSLLCSWQKHRESQGDGSWVPATEEGLVANFGFGLFKRGKIREALKWLKESGLVSYKKLGPRVPTRYKVNVAAIERRILDVLAKRLAPESELTPEPPQTEPTPPPEITPVATAVETDVDIVEDEPDEIDLMIGELVAYCTPPMEDAPVIPEPPQTPAAPGSTPQPAPTQTTPKPSRPVTPASSLALPTPPRDREGIKQWIEQVDLGDSVRVDLAVRLLKQVYRNHPAPHAILAGLDPWAFKEPWSLRNFEWADRYMTFGRDRKRATGNPNPTKAEVAKYLYNQFCETAHDLQWQKFSTNHLVFQDWCVANGYAERPPETQETALAGKPRDIYLQPDRAASQSVETEAQMIERVYRIAEAKSLIDLEGFMQGLGNWDAAQRRNQMVEGVLDVDFAPTGREGEYVITKLWKTWPTSN